MASAQRRTRRLDAPARAVTTTPWIAGLTLIVAAWLTFAPTLDTPFFMDDGEAIVRNPYVTSLTPLSRALTSPPKSAVSGRPLVSLSLAATHAITGPGPRGFHAVNLVVHTLAGLVLFGVLRRSLRHPRCGLGPEGDALAFTAAVLWVVHPLNTEVMAYVTQRTESMMALCYLMALYAFARATEGAGQRPGWLAIAVAAGVAGAACKESIATLPVMVLLYDSVLGTGSVGSALRRRRWFYASLSLTWVAVAALSWSGPRSGSAGFGVGLSPLDYLLTQGPIILQYLRLSLWPHPLVADYGLATAPRVADVWPAVVVVVVMAAGTLWLWRRHRFLAYLATWWFITLAPTSSIVPIVTEVGAERRTYLPLMALVLMIVLAVRWAALRWTSPTWRPRIAATATALGVLAMGATSAARSRDYADGVRIWQTVVAARPHGRAHHNLGIELAARGRVDEALAEYRLAAETVPEAHYSVGFVLASRNAPAAAAEAFRMFLQQDPDDVLAPRATNMLGMALAATGDDVGAAEAYQRTLLMRPDDQDARGGLTDALTAIGGRALEEGRLADASGAFARAVDIAPQLPAARLNYGRSLMAQGRSADAEAAFRAGLDLAPNDANLIAAYAALMATRGALASARREFERALALDPANADARHGLAVLDRVAGARR